MRSCRTSSGKGGGLAALSWVEEDGLLWPKLDVWNPGALVMRDGAWRVRDATGQEHPLERGMWLLYTPYGPKRPWEKGLWRTLALPWLAKADAIRYWARDNEVGALRVAYAEGPTGETGKELAQLLADLGGGTRASSSPRGGGWTCSRPRRRCGAPRRRPSPGRTGP